MAEYSARLGPISTPAQVPRGVRSLILKLPRTVAQRHSIKQVDQNPLEYVLSLFNIWGMDDQLPSEQMQPGQLLGRGVCRFLASHDFVTLEEFVPQRGKRVDVMALGPKGEIWVIECKSSRVDFTSDGKWGGYLEWCDRYFWAVDTDFPTDLLPDDTGLIIADAYNAEIIRMSPEVKLAGARRTALTRRFARHAARRLQGYRDPRVF